MAKVPSEVRFAFPVGSLRHVWQTIQENSLSVGIAFLLVWIVGAPVVTLIVSSLRQGDFISPGPFTLDNYRTVFLGAQTYPALINTLIYAGVVSAISLTLATVFAWLVERTDMPGKNWAWTMMLIPLAMPGILRSMAWILLLSPNTGIINVGLRHVLGFWGVQLHTGPLNVFTLPGMIFVEAMGGSTTLFLLMVGAFRLMDPSLEEAARVSGASSLTTLRRVTLGLMKPAVLAAAMYAFLGNLDDFEVPLLIGLQAGIYLFPTLIYFTAYITPSYGLASAYSSIFILFTLVMVWIYYKVVIRQSDKYASITGKGFRPRRLSLGRWRWMALGFFGVFFCAQHSSAFFHLGLGLPIADLHGAVGVRAPIRYTSQLREAGARAAHRLLHCQYGSAWNYGRDCHHGIGLLGLVVDRAAENHRSDFLRRHSFHSACYSYRGHRPRADRVLSQSGDQLAAHLWNHVDHDSGADDTLPSVRNQDLQCRYDPAASRTGRSGPHERC